MKPLDLTALGCEITHLLTSGCYTDPSRASEAFRSINCSLAELREAREVLALARKGGTPAGGRICCPVCCQPDCAPDCRLAALLPKEDEAICDRCSKALGVEDMIENDGQVVCDDCACLIADEDAARAAGLGEDTDGK